MYEPLVLPDIRRRPRKKTSKDDGVTMDMAAIRARRAKLEVMTMTMKIPNDEEEASNDRAARYSASKIRRSSISSSMASVMSSPPVSPPSRAVKLHPLSAGSEENDLDRQKTSDPLLRRHQSSRQSQDQPRRQSQDQPRKESQDESRRQSPDLSNDQSNKQQNGAPWGKASSAPLPDIGTQQHMGAPSWTGGSAGGPGVGYELSTDDLLPDILRQLRSSEERTQLTGAIAARQQLSIADNPPLDRYLQAGILPLLIQLLDKDHPGLQFEAMWSITNIAAGTEQNTIAIIDAGGLPKIRRLLTGVDKNVSLQAVWAISNIVGESDVTRDKVVNADIVPVLAEMVTKHTGAEAQRIIAWTFSNLMRFKPNSMDANQRMTCLKALRYYLSVDEDTARVDAARGLEFASDGDSVHIEEVLSLGVVPEVLELAQSDDYRLVQVAVRILGNIVSGEDHQTDAVLEAGAAPVMVTLLRDDEEQIRKEAAWALSNIMAGTAAQLQVALDANALPTLVYLLQDETTGLRVGKEVCWCLGNTCTMGTAEGGIDELVMVGGPQAMLSYYKKHQYDAALGVIIFKGLSDVIQKTTQHALMKKRLKKSEVEALLKQPISSGDELATNLWTELKTNVFK